jgi:hypothetical protein
MFSTFYTAALLVTCAAAANITTTIWLPGSANANATFLGSVVEQDGDQTLLALAYMSTPSMPNYFTQAPSMATVKGTTFVAYNFTASGSVSIAARVECRRSSGGVSAVQTCTEETSGADLIISMVCAGLTVESLPAYCTASSAVNSANTQTLGGERVYSINNYPLIITGGTEKLGAQAMATPNTSSASVTAPTAGSGPGPRSGTGATPSQTVSGGSSSAQQATGGVAPLNTMAPALAGLGAAAAVFFF